MKLFECQNCGQPLYFENTSCESCGLRLGYLPDQQVVTALREADGLWRSLAVPQPLYRFCANAQYDVCNWLVGSDHPEIFCAACRHNRTIPDLSRPENLLHWRRIEFAKHRLFYTLLKLRLPLTTRREDANGLAFDFLSPPADGSAETLVTGHAGGLITLNVAEADDIERERQRKSLAEPYRTLLDISGTRSLTITGITWWRIRPPSMGFDSCSATSVRITRSRCSATTPRGPRPTGPSGSSRHTRARTPGRILRKPGRTISTWSIRSKPPPPSAFGCARRSPG